MKLAYFTDTYLPNRDGVVTSILGFRHELEKRGNEVYVFAPGSRKIKKENADPRVFYTTSTPFRPYPAYRIALFPFMMERDVKDAGAGLVHTHGIASMGLAAARTAYALELPFVGTFHTMVTEATHYVYTHEVGREFVESMMWKYLQGFFNRCHQVTAPSPCTAKLMEQHGIANVNVVPNGVDVERFSPKTDPGSLRNTLGVRGPMILHVGRLVVEKNLDTLIRAAPAVLSKKPDAKFVVLSEGPAKADYVEMVEGAGLAGSFIFTGFVPDADLPLYYAAADVFAIPSRFETQGVVALEAMAAGRKVVGANWLALPDFIEHGRNGFLFDANDPADCGAKILEALDAGPEIGKAARKTAEDYSIERCTDRLLDVYKKAMAR